MKQDGQQRSSHLGEATKCSLRGSGCKTVTPMAGTGQDITERKRAEQEREKLIGELKTALAQIKTLSGLLPICAGCKKIRDCQDYWHQVESYIAKDSDATFTHGLCPDRNSRAPQANFMISQWQPKPGWKPCDLAGPEPRLQSGPRLQTARPQLNAHP